MTTRYDELEPQGDSQEREDTTPKAGSSEGNGGNAYNRPRRPDAEIVTYIRSLPLDEASAHEEIKAYLRAHAKQNEEEGDNCDREEDVSPTLLSVSLSAAEEVAHHLASLAGDEVASQRLESLCRIIPPDKAVALLQHLESYYVHLSTHRYASHVVQTFLHRAMFGTEHDEDIVAATLALEEGENQSIEPIVWKERLLAVVEEVLPYASQLAEHLCGSHVLRTVLCALGGVVPQQQSQNFSPADPVEAAKKKKKKKKKKKGAVDSADSSQQGKGQQVLRFRRAVHCRVDPHDVDIRQARERLVDALLVPSSSFADMCCHPSAGPLLITMIHVLSFVSSKDKGMSLAEETTTTTGLADKTLDRRLGMETGSSSQVHFEPHSKAEAVVSTLLGLEENATGTTQQQQRLQKEANATIFHLAGDRFGSRVLEACLACCHDEMQHVILRQGGLYDATLFAQYVDHHVGNFVVQSILADWRFGTKEEEDDKTFLSTCMLPLLESGYLLDKTCQRPRMGVVWRMLQWGVGLGKQQGQEMLLRCIRRGYGQLQEEGKLRLRANQPATNTKQQNQQHKKKKRASSIVLGIDECVPHIMDIAAPERENDEDDMEVDNADAQPQQQQEDEADSHKPPPRLGLDVTGARAVYQMLQFRPLRLCADTIRGIVEQLSAAELEWIAKDGVGSRCIMDGILEGPVMEEDSPFADGAIRLVAKLRGRWVSLAVDRVGHHTVRKLFWALVQIWQTDTGKKLPRKAWSALAELVSELSKAVSSRLAGNAMGRGITSECLLRDFVMGGEDEFRIALRRTLESRNAEQVTNEKNANNATATQNAQKKDKDDLDFLGDVSSKNAGHQKRPRSEEKDDGGGETHKSAKKKKTRKNSSSKHKPSSNIVASIMDVMTVGPSKSKGE